MATIKTRTKVENYSELIIAAIEKKEKNVKLDNLLTILNYNELDINKIKVVAILDGNESPIAKYEKPEVNELFVLEFKDVDDIKEIKVKGTVGGNKISILENFEENYIQIKVEYGKYIKKKDIEEFIKLF